jgi:hypothetical protein
MSDLTPFSLHRVLELGNRRQLLQAGGRQATPETLINVLCLCQQQHATRADLQKSRSETLQQKSDQQFCRLFQYQRRCQPAAGFRV